MKECTSKGNKISGVIFKYLDNKNFVFKETAENYYLLDNENDIYCKVRLRKTDMVCFIEYKLIRQVERFFCTDYHIVENIIGEYVENTMNTKLSKIEWNGMFSNIEVENTMNIKVSKTNSDIGFAGRKVENTMNIKVSNTKSLVNIET